MTRHLDLGSGKNPADPCSADELFGIDICDFSNFDNSNIIVADLNISRIPFPDNYFDSISAFDFLEHILPVAIVYDKNENKNKTIFPFINLMNEIYRVLRKDGLFISSTPCLPNYDSVFSDPTHVNYFTSPKIQYFTNPNLYAKDYGFYGIFDVIESRHIQQESLIRVLENRNKHQFKKSSSSRLNNYLKKFVYRITPGLLKKFINSISNSHTKNTHLFLILEAK
jgi:SAM-dependent methyltransferase